MAGLRPGGVPEISKLREMSLVMEYCAPHKSLAYLLEGGGRVAAVDNPPCLYPMAGLRTALIKSPD